MNGFNMKKYSILFSLIFMTFFIASPIFANNQLSEAEMNSSIFQNRYSSYKEERQAPAYNGEKIIYDDVKQLNVQPEHLAELNGNQTIFVERNQDVHIEVEAPEHALYQIGFQYIIANDHVLPTQLEMRINDSLPFYELGNLTFESRWGTPEEIPIDKYGNEIVPQPEKLKVSQLKMINDSSFRSTEPFLIELEEGKNTLSFRVTEGSMNIEAVILSAEEMLNVHEPHEVNGDELMIIQAQDIAYRNDSSIRAGASFNNDLVPYNASRRVLNYLDDQSFKRPGHRVTYEFEVEEEGYYYLGMDYRQNVNADFPVFFNIYLNDQIPFASFKNYPIHYQNTFAFNSFIDSETQESIPIYLEKGVHSLSFEISLAPLKETIEHVEQLIRDIQALSLELTNLAGPNADRHRDIDVEQFIPGVTNQLVSWADELGERYEALLVFSDSSSEIGAFAALTIAESQLRSLADEIDKLIVRKGELATGANSITSQLSNLLQETNDNGVAINQLFIYQDPADIPSSKGFISKQFANIERLFRSFGDQDYEVNNRNPEHLQVWINRPRQYIEIIQQLIDEQFTPETGIEVDISLMPDQNKLILANAAGEAPDVAVGVNYALPFEIAIRGALKDLTEYQDFPEVKNRFPEGLHVPATIDQSIFALPDTMNFWVMFYRKDILESMGLPIPNTLDEIRTFLPELQTRGMNFFYPTAGMPGLKIFAGTMPIIYQNGGQFYGETIHRTTLNENASIEGMRELTELFTIYNIPYDVPSFYQQFKDGTLPIGISDYFMYNLILNAAPEIANSWDITLMPGIENEEGEIERWSAGGAESNIIFDDSDKSDQAWEFLKWWTSTEVQVTFGNVLQTTYGEEYIWNTANIEAYENLPWITSHKEVILAQTQWVTEVPRVPGSYMLEREVSNAYNSVILDGNNLRTAIDLASKRVNRETLRKLEEFGFITDGQINEPYTNPEFITE
ncbi:ABC transporter substrate-binding protein [Bacillus sp. TS-2]|nr:ABC transporter substrate-binding protein [Bacillus sp. TS-2]